MQKEQSQYSTEGKEEKFKRRGKGNEGADGQGERQKQSRTQDGQKEIYPLKAQEASIDCLKKGIS